jgi:phosphate starvation-inducible PhoH-like protein
MANKRKPKTWRELSSTKEFYDKVAEEIQEKNVDKQRIETEKVRERAKIKPLTDNQGILLNAIETYKLVICNGKAGTGKTFCAVAAAIGMLLDGRIDKIIFTRPAVEAGESLGFAPGTIDEKYAMFTRPFMRNAGKVIPISLVRKLIKEEKIELTPIAHMQGDTFDDCFVIVDEVQNLTNSQAKMVLTRIGINCKVVYIGDAGQSFLPYNGKNSLLHVMDQLYGDSDIFMMSMGPEDIVRSRLVQFIEENL